ncbi:PTS sugar transporter subunit IIA [Companilactobacillus futsaii]|uniref:PTS sugar transporter subunit IIA n=2 Tax=Companilactobacillus futsaii TaxID=938155 RepID=A0A5B7T2T8_9LACO|nr:PTS sugar transporter subunit IIA [Companilactobacillus futsaii]KRK97288.1 PTS system fructose-specific transporter subunit IIABC [Companilactobacillus futsaii JCM 17355]QCX24869.1 PTS sugar transporter subunit IIA [Companilactobacillus futsaii]
MAFWKKIGDFFTGKSAKKDNKPKKTIVVVARDSNVPNQKQIDQMMDLSKILNEDNIVLDVEADTKEKVLKYLANFAKKSNGKVDSEAVYGKLLMREAEASTVLGNGIVMPHVQDESITELKMFILKLHQPIIWDDQKSTDIVLALLGPDPEANYEHVPYMSTIVRLLLRKDFIVTLKSASTKEIIFKLFENS